MKKLFLIALLSTGYFTSKAQTQLLHISNSAFPPGTLQCFFEGENFADPPCLKSLTSNYYSGFGAFSEPSANVSWGGSAPIPTTYISGVTFVYTGAGVTEVYRVDLCGATTMTSPMPITFSGGTTANILIGVNPGVDMSVGIQ
ncbi:MAG: hypothetical protein WC716_09855 [Chitinophagaceae bacterium]|jgi:hypothetical protein